jgi:hypothetical protein
MPRSCFHCPRAGTGKLGSSFVRITALLVSCLPEIAQCLNYAFMLNAALMLSFSHVQGQASLVSLLSASRRCSSPALASGWGQATVSSSGKFHILIEYRKNNSHFSSWSQSLNFSFSGQKQLTNYRFVFKLLFEINFLAKYDFKKSDA